MTIRAPYNQVMIEKAQAIAREAAELPPNDRDAYCQDRCGLTYHYLKRVGGVFKVPSDRTLMNLGYELYAKDLATGELSKMELHVPCDWNPRNPRMNPVSTPVSVKPPSEVSSASE